MRGLNLTPATATGARLCVTLSATGSCNSLCDLCRGGTCAFALADPLYDVCPVYGQCCEV